MLLLTSCVGTIEDTETQKGSSDSLQIGKLNFPGITSAKAIAHNKVEITFPPAGNSQGDVTYLIKYDGLAEPITAIEQSLFRSFTGEYKYTVTNLNPFTTYNFNVTCVDDLNGAEGNNTVTVDATTFLQPTSDFGGVGLVSNVQGLAGLNSLKIEWVKAPLLTDFGTPDPRDVANYQVTILDGDLTPDRMNDDTLSTQQRRVILVDSGDREVTVGGLKQAHTYHVQVRAINHAHVNNFASDPNFKHEENTKYISKSTLSPGVGDIDFNENSFNAQTLNSEGGLSSFSTTWAGASGAFNHYRLVYSKSTSNAGVEEAWDIAGNLYFSQNGHVGGTTCTANVTDTDPFDSRCACTNYDTHNNDSSSGGTDGEDDLFCIQLDFDEESKLVANLSSYTKYNIILQVCADVNCINYTRSRLIENIETDPNIATYSFKNVMRGPASINKLDQIFIDLDSLPDFNSGVLDGFQVSVTDSNGNEVVLGNPSLPVDESIASQPPIRMEPFDAKNDSYIILTGYDLLNGPEYTFEVTPFKNTGSSIELENNIKKTYANISFTPSPPGLYDNVNNFDGPTSCADINNNSGNLRVTWDPPATNSGIFSHYQIYVEEKADPTDLSITGAAITYPTLPLIDGTKTAYTIEGLDGTKDYVVTVRTYYFYDGTTVLSPAEDAEIILCN